DRPEHHRRTWPGPGAGGPQSGSATLPCGNDDELVLRKAGTSRPHLDIVAPLRHPPGGASRLASATPTSPMRPSLSILAFLGRRRVGRRNHSRRASAFILPTLTLRRQAGSG